MGPQGPNAELPYMELDKSKKLQMSSIGPKYLIMSRIGANNEETLANVSPFLLKKVIDNVACGEVDLCKKTRNGSVLIKTKTTVQASKIIQITALNQTIKVEVSEHRVLNYTKGVIYSNELRNIPENEILEELRSQQVSDVKKIMKKTDNYITETGLIVLTFSSLNLPTEIYVGYERIHVRPFIPLPLRCNNCMQYGHTAKYCKNDKICYNCGNKYHLDVDKKEPCKKEKKCINCSYQNLPHDDHNSISKVCPIFKKKQEIQAIKTTQNIDTKSATKIYFMRHQSESTTYASTIKGDTKKPIDNIGGSQAKNSVNKDDRQPVTYSDIHIGTTSESDTEIDHSCKSSVKVQKKIKIFPISTSARAKRNLKNKSNSPKPIDSKKKKKGEILNDDKMDTQL